MNDALTWGLSADEQQPANRPDAGWRHRLDSRILKPSPSGSAMADLLNRLKTALADRYSVERELGAGGMVTVYLAEDRKHHRPVAIKVLKPELAAAIGSERFLREIEIAARLRHPHSLPLHDSGDADGLLYYVMPYVQGESLRARLDREKQLPVDDALLIARELSDALSFAHSHDVIHRDIKPENILLEAGHAVVADFGIARAIGAAGGEKLTQTGIALWTPIYMSPEQAAGRSEIDGRSDLYSLACVLYEKLAGQPPFTGPTAESVVQQHLRWERALTTEAWNLFDPAVAGILYAGLRAADSAFARLEASFARRSESLVFNMRHPFIATIREDPRYRDLMDRMGLRP